MLLVSLMGEQPVPNYLPIRYINPKRVLLVYTDTTDKQTNRLRKVLSTRLPSTEVGVVKVNPYHLHEIYEVLREHLQGEDDILFNGTGGTKIMSFAAVLLAAQYGKEFIYYQSEKNLSRLFWYRIEQGVPVQKKLEDLPSGLFSLDDYLRLYLDDYRVEGYHKEENGRLSAGGAFEQAVAEELKRAGFEVLAGIRPQGEGNQLEIDLAFRLNNQVGIAELKVGDEKGESIKKGIDQLTTAGQREYLGTYVKLFLIIARGERFLAKEHKELAARHNVKIVNLPDYSRLTPYRKEAKWRNILIQRLKEVMTS